MYGQYTNTEIYIIPLQLLDYTINWQIAEGKHHAAYERILLLNEWLYLSSKADGETLCSLFVLWPDGNLVHYVLAGWQCDASIHIQSYKITQYTWVATYFITKACTILYKCS